MPYHNAQSWSSYWSNNHDLPDKMLAFVSRDIEASDGNAPIRSVAAWVRGPHVDEDELARSDAMDDWRQRIEAARTTDLEQHEEAPRVELEPQGAAEFHEPALSAPWMEYIRGGCECDSSSRTVGPGVALPRPSAVRLDSLEGCECNSLQAVDGDSDKRNT
jgi:hypothetical protein